MRREPSVVVVTDRCLVPARSGNRQRILGLIRCLRATGRHVVLVGSNPGPAEHLDGEVDEIVRVDASPFSSGDIDRFDARPFRRALARVVVAYRPDTVIAEYAWMAPAMSDLPPGPRRAVDCHDVLYERSQRFTRAGLHPWVYCTPEQERRRLRCADVLIAIQPRDQVVLQSLLPDKRVICVTPFVDLPPAFTPRTIDTPTVLAVGGEHSGNDGICRFAEAVWPDVLAHWPDARLEVVGAIGARIADRPGVVRIGQVDELLQRYAAAAIVVCPIAVGTGLKIKMVEALRFGKAVVATPAAAEGLLPLAEPAWIAAPSVDACGPAVLELLRDRAARSTLEAAAFAYGQRYFSRDAAMADVRSLLQTRHGALSRALLSIVTT